MKSLRLAVLTVVAVALAMGMAGVRAVAAPESPEAFFNEDDLSLYLNGVAADALAADGAAGEAGAPAEAAGAADQPPAGDGPPLPLHSLEGVAGGACTPMAYFANPGVPGTKVGLPSVSYTYLVAGSKVINSIALSEVFYRRIEFSYAYNRVGLGDFPGDVRGAIGVHLGRTHVNMHNWNLRGILVEENTSGPWMPQIVGGVHFKHNQSVQNMDTRLGGGARALGFERNNGVDYTITAGKMFPKGFLDRPVLANVGLRWTTGAQTGWLGFSDTYRTNVEANIAWVPFDWLAIGYEYKEKQNPYGRVGNLIGVEDAWHTILLAWIVNEHCTLAGVYGHLGNIVNGEENGGWGIQLKYEF
ncbi:MAG TPA: DUF3034 family protein [Phycisphaerae bacterium]|nr:DUF3034 family protein [Phycisphaerae bacterium]